MPKYMMEAVRYTSGVRCATDWYQEANNQIFRRGAVVTLDVNGLVNEFTGNEDILGVASMNASGTLGNKVGIWLATSDSIFIASIGSSDITLLSDISRLYGIAKEDGVWVVDKNEVVNTRVCIVNIDSRDNLNTVNGRVLFTFLPDSRQLRF